MKCEDRMVRAGLSALLLAVASVTACESEDVPVGASPPDASADAPHADASASADAPWDVAFGDAHDVTVSPNDGGVEGDASAAEVGTDANLSNTDGSSPDAYLDGSSLDGSTPDGSTPDGSTLDGSSLDGGATFGGRVLVATTSFASNATEVATLDLANRVTISSGASPDTDAVPRTSEGRSFVLERTNDILKILDSEGVPTASIAFRQDGGPSQNPHDVVVIPGTSTAYVPLYDSGRIAVVDLDTASVTSMIDLSSFADANDSDHSPDIDGGLYVPATGLVYFTLQRIDLHSGFPVACPAVPSVVVAVDPRTRQVVAPDAGPSVIELAFVSPSSMAFDVQSGRLLVLSNGCAEVSADGGRTRIHHGIEAITLATGQTLVLYAPTSPNFLSNLILLGPGSALVNSFDANYAELWNRWDPASATLGDALTDVPDSAVRETADTLLGVRQGMGTDGGPAGYDVVRYRVSTGQTTLAAPNPLAAPYDFVGGVAYVP